MSFCGSCCITITCWVVWIILGALLVFLISIALARELPVPGFVLRRAEAELAKSGLSLQFGRARFDPTGKILLEEVQLRMRPFDDPLLTCRLLYVRHSFWSALAGRTLPEEIRLEGATLQLPAMLSPTGTAEPVVSNLAAVLHHEGGRLWRVEQFAGRLGRLTITLQGEVATPLPKPGAAPLELEALTARFLRTARHLAPFLHRFDAFDEPTLAVQLEVNPVLGNTADILFTAAAAHQPWDQPLELGLMAAGTRLRLDGRGVRPVQVHLAARRINHRDDFAAENIRALLQAEVQYENFTGRALELRAAAGSVTYAGEQALGPVLHADLSAWPSVRSTAAVQLDGEFITAEVEARLTEQSARLQASGRVSPALINRVLTQHTPRAAPYFVLGDPVAFQVNAVLAPGWRFDRATSRIDAGRLDSRGVGITAARGRVDLVGRSFLAHEARVTMGDNEARGSYWMDFATTDYRMLLEGRLRPADINGWFRGDWWLTFWNKYFDFPVAPPTGEADLQGRWKDPSLSSNFLRASARSATVWGGDFEQVDATVFVRPAFTHGLALHATRAGGTQTLAGTFQRVGAPNSRDTTRFEFDFNTNADTAVLGRMLEGRADDVLASLQFTQPPKVHAWGAIDNGVPAYRFTGEAQGSLHYYGFPLDSVRVAGGVSGANVHLGDIEFTTAGGRGSGRASLTGPPEERRLGFDAFLNKANLGRTVRAVQEYNANRAGQAYVATTESKFIQQTANSSLDVALSAQGDPASVASFQGTGNAALTGAELGEIHLFGLLSQVLNGFSLSFSSLKLDAAHTSFTLRDGILSFPDLKVTGPSAVIDARGLYTLDTNSLDFSAKFKPYDQPGSLLAAAVSLVINPLTSILELKLGGRLDDPQWSVNIGSTSAPIAPSVKPVAPTPQ